MRYTSGKIFYRFHQNPNLVYFSGIQDPNIVMLIRKKPESKKGYHLTYFVDEPTQHDLIWEGPRFDKAEAMKSYGADEVLDIRELDTFMLSNYRSKDSVIYSDHLPFASTSAAQHQILTNIFDVVKGAKPVEQLVHQMRLIKSEYECEQIRTSCAIASEAFRKLMQKAKFLRTERQLEAVFDYQCRIQGAQKLAYVPVAAGSGRNSCIIHYTRNNNNIKLDDLILMDAGCYFGDYASDITRTFPASGKFSEPQRKLYECVLRVQKACIKECRSDTGMNLHDLYLLSAGLMRQEVRRTLGWADVSEKLLFEFMYPHHVSHHLGMDVHDCERARVSKYAHWTKNSWDGSFHPGMILTVEPGLYIPPKTEDKDVEARWEMVPTDFRGISVRIEDNVLVTPSAREPDVLTNLAPKEVADIEAIMQNQD